MKKNKNKIIIISSIVVVIVTAIIVFLITFSKLNLTTSERKWIDDNITSTLNINIVNDANIFGSNGEGVFYDFLDDFSMFYNLKINPITFSHENIPNELSFMIKQEPKEKDVVFYQDHYIIISNRNFVINSYEDLFGKSIGVLSADMSLVTKHINTDKITFNQYDSIEGLFESIDDNNFLIIPRYLYLDIVLKNDYNVLFNLSDINYYYVLNTDQEVLSNILFKYYKKHWETKFAESFNLNKFDLYTTSMYISEAEVEGLRGGSFKYGFLSSAPYDVYRSSNFGGVNAILLKKFIEFSDIDIDFVYFKKEKEFQKAIAEKTITMYFDKYNYKNNFTKTDKGYNLSFNILLKRTNSDVINSLTYLEGKEIYLEKDSKLIDYFSSIKDITIKTYKTDKDIKKISKSNAIVIIDSNSYNYYQSKYLKDFTLRYIGDANITLNYKLNSKSALYNLFNKFVAVEDTNSIINIGVNDYYETVNKGNLYSLLAQYIIGLALILGTAIVVIFNKTKKINISKRIKKEEKLKYVDQLTSLKNRNYLNENIESWNNNTVYPQAILVMDLNGIKDLNDKLGYEEGDKQIKAFSNILIKRQLDNSEIMRTDGNEYVVYLVGYDKTKIVNYIRKLNKDVEKLPHDLGAKFGFSLIEDEIKTIEDALNEALIEMRSERKNDEG